MWLRVACNHVSFRATGNQSHKATPTEVERPFVICVITEALFHLVTVALVAQLRRRNSPGKSVLSRKVPLLPEAARRNLCIGNIYKPFGDMRMYSLFCVFVGVSLS